jgi:hypothetical protein
VKFISNFNTILNTDAILNTGAILNFHDKKTIITVNSSSDIIFEVEQDRKINKSETL